MTIISRPQLLSEIRDPESPSSRIASLRALKNDLIGHDQKKQAWIEHGIVPVLSTLLASSLLAGDRPATVQTNGDKGCSACGDGLAAADATHREAVIIINSLAQGGPAFIAPILASDILPSLFEILSSTPSSPSSSSSSSSSPALDLAVLQCLHTIADRLPLAYEHGYSQLRHLSALLYSPVHITSLLRILEQTSTLSSAQSCIELAAELISKTCTEESHKVTLAEAGVLDALATRVASFIVAQGYVLPGAENYAGAPGGLGSIPPPAPPNAKLGPILRAICVILEYSKSRADHFLTSPAIVTVFPRNIQNIPLGEVKRGPWGSHPVGFVVSKQNSSNPIDSLLPAVPSPQPTGSTSFPPLGSHSSFDKHAHFFSPPPLQSESPSASDEHECAIISWLVSIAREGAGMDRLLAIRLVAILFRLGLAKKHRVTMLGYLVVPLLLQMLEKGYTAPEDTESSESGSISQTSRVKEEAPATLATLVMDSRELQKHAADGGAIKKLSQMLKESFNAVEDAGRSMWSPVPNGTSLKGFQPEISSLGPPGVSPSVFHRVRVREGVLRALSALSLFREEYRKAICDNGVVPLVIDSLKPYEPESTESSSDAKSAAVEGNPIPTLLAACAAARSLTRSVSVLRTSLIDAGVANPIFKLVKSRNVEIQIAATSVICNLALDFSPMKEAIISANMIPTLCEHSHSENTKLRLESIWALKHIAYNSTNDIKMKIVETLEPAWLKRVICEDPTDPSIQRKAEEEMTGNEMEITPPLGDPTDIQNLVHDYNSRDSESQTPDLRMIDTVMPAKASLDTFLTDSARRRKLALNGDLDHTKQMRRDDIQVQEQILDLVRNLICGTGAPEMIDYLFQEVTDLFDILADKLRPKLRPGHGRKDPSSKDNSIPTEILSSVTYIMINIAAGLPRHRQLLMLHPDLLRLMMPLFQHASKEVRVNCVWVVINLTVEDDQRDRPTCRERAAKLRELGVLEQLVRLEDDPECDVRQRTKTALDLMGNLLASAC
uniref:Armadillo repeat protein n=1 Tax=Coccidioides posadasii RMSCC 3488 TaxID=454284 RepID=A0A0J6F1S5_COCPO|nr:armadillo repeat protein [Coccidioides posadasii RMSCC 3488]